VSKGRIKVLVAKPELDGHNRGAKVVALGLRDEGIEVIYTGLRQTMQMIAEVALQEQVDVVGLSCLPGAHNHFFPGVMKELQKRGMGDVLVIGGGSILQKDIPFLLESGANAVFGPGTPVKEITRDIFEQSLQSCLMCLGWLY